MPRTPPLAVPSVLAFTGLLILIQFTFLDYAYPTLRGDGRVFLPAALEYARSGLLVNHAWSAATFLDPTREGRFLYHGFLFPMIVGKVTPTPTYEGIQRVLWAIRAMNLLLFVGLALKFSGWRLSWARAAVLGALTFVLHTCLMASLDGRPEPLVGALLLGALLGVVSSPLSLRPLFAGAGLGLSGAASPLIALVFAVFFAAFMAFRNPPRQAMLGVVSTAVVAIGIYLLAWVPYPYSFSDWVPVFGKMAGIASTGVGRPDRLLHPVHLYRMATLAAGGWAMAVFLRRTGGKPRWPMGFTLFTILGGVLLLRFGILEKNYYLVPAVPFFLLSVWGLILGTSMRPEVSSFTKREPHLPGVSGWRRLIQPEWVIGGWLAASVGVGLGAVTIQARAAVDGPSLVALRKEVAALRAIPDRPLFLDSQVFPATEDYSGLFILQVKDPPPPPPDAIVVVRQLKSGPPAESYLGLPLLSATYADPEGYIATLLQTWKLTYPYAVYGQPYGQE